MSVTFLGTSSGGGPSTSRNCSSLVADLLGDGTLWMVDCAEGTLASFSFSHTAQIVPIYGYRRIIPILRNLLFPVPVGEDAARLEALRKPFQEPTIEIYGPAGIRTFVRSILKMTLTRMSDKYIVHELLTPTDTVTSCDQETMHVNEVAGKNLVSSEDGFWRDVTEQKGVFGPVAVDAGPISHRGRQRSPFARFVILGDTNDPSAIVPLCIDPSPSLLIHEASDAHISQDIDPKAKRSYDTVKQKALARGHSIPEMAGAFAKTIGAQKLVLNHIGGRQVLFPAPNHNEGFRLKGIRANVIAEIERQATEAWGMGTARAAWDYMRVAIPPLDPTQTTPQDAQSSGTQEPTPSYGDYPTAYNTWNTNHGKPSGSHGHERTRGDHRSQNVAGSSWQHQSQQHTDHSVTGNVDPSPNRGSRGWKRRR
ncbi:hypothetical protein BT96DRAFT_934211 [Gymnopus androsaceus JB14]|uniref:Metallo-beta-lactamase domain-containing protein n=1 Tax=Gymnopus androsaceus JB14 TaxID=1447944 RepID=A0A6A4I6Z0_9AGAR|nr:hypothetical protein BT96DRAFT_934211 [Gymnopus androsaceus JB14]